MSIKKWHLNAIERPELNGVYLVRLSKEGDLLAPTTDSVGEFVNGCWKLRPVHESEGYFVSSWRYM